MRFHASLAVLLIVLAFVVSGGRPASAADKTASAQLAAIIEEAWEFTLSEDPLFATNTGDHRYDDQLPHVSLGRAKPRDGMRRGFLARLEIIDRDALTPTEQTNYDILERSLARRYPRFRVSVASHAGDRSQRLPHRVSGIAA